MDLQALRQEFESWPSRAISQPAKDREQNALDNCIRGIDALIAGTVDRKTTTAIATDAIKWLNEHASGADAHRLIEVPVYQRYIQALSQD